MDTGGWPGFQRSDLRHAYSKPQQPIHSQKRDKPRTFGPTTSTRSQGLRSQLDDTCSATRSGCPHAAFKCKSQPACPDPRQGQPAAGVARSEATRGQKKRCNTLGSPETLVAVHARNVPGSRSRVIPPACPAPLCPCDALQTLSTNISRLKLCNSCKEETAANNASVPASTYYAVCMLSFAQACLVASSFARCFGPTLSLAAMVNDRAVARYLTRRRDLPAARGLRTELDAETVANS